MNTEHQPKRVLQFSAIALGLAAAGQASAAQVTTSAAIAPGVIWTDNVCLTKDNKKDDWVATVTPSGSIGVTGERAYFNLGGSVQFNSLTDSQLEDQGCAGGNLGDRDQWSPRLQANGFMRFNEEFTVDVEGRSNQNEVAAGAAGGGDDLNRRGNTNTFYRYAIKPSYVTTVSQHARGSLRYAYDEVINSEQSRSDSKRNAVSAGLTSTGTSKLSWGLSGRASRTEYSDSLFGQPREDTDLANVRLTLARQFNNTWNLNGTYGYEFNDFQTGRDVDTDGDAWDIGVVYTPSDRTSVSAGMGDRFFGDTPRLNAVHRYKNSIFNASYEKTLTFDRDINTLDEEFLPGFENTSTLNSRSPILDERYSLGYSYTGRRATYSLYGNYSEQTRAEDGAQGEFTTIAGSFSPVLSPGWTAVFTLAWDKSEPTDRFGQEFPDGSANVSDTYRAGVSLGKRINQLMSLTGNYTFTDRQSDIRFGEYQENRIFVTLSFTL